MSHIPYGYKIIKGQAVIHEEEAITVQELYQAYIEFNALLQAAKKAGVNKTHSSIGRILSNPVYLGDGFYPKIIDDEIFNQVQILREKKKESLNRNSVRKNKIAFEEKTYVVKSSELKYDDPYKQAEYMYSLIEEVVK